jgi:hypothetical protein
LFFEDIRKAAGSHQHLWPIEIEGHGIGVLATVLLSQTSAPAPIWKQWMQPRPAAALVLYALENADFSKPTSASIISVQ